MIRERLLVTGIVQGVGFRPFVWRRATGLGVAGFVENVPGGVLVEVQGPADSVAAFLAGLADAAPPPAVIEHVVAEAIPPASLGPAEGFQIRASLPGAGPRTLVPPDVATCEACLRELRDLGDHRRGHPFITCTACGPRYTIVEGLPYDRAATTMSGFPPCPRCAEDYADPADRRFHAETISCPACGPVAWFTAATTAADASALSRPTTADSAAAIAAARALLAGGGILAVKGTGGFRLACDATRDDAVARLRARKHRPAKPLAVMVADSTTARRIASLDDAERLLLEGPARPIVLLRRRPGSGLAEGVAPASDQVGVMLPAAPLDHLLVAGLPPLVMTSGNLADEPLATDNAEAVTRLRGIADGFLLHDLRIHVPCDDSVVRRVAGLPLPIRLARGFAPAPLTLAADGPPVLAVGGELKAAACLAVGERAVLGQHVGDTGSLATLAALERAAEHLLDLFAVAPAAIVADLHPGSVSAGWAARFAAARGIPLVRVQHHEAHVAALMAEHFGGLDPPTACLVACFDGTGYWPDGGIAGGEFFLVDGGTIRRVAHLAPFPLPGGDAAIRHPWRAALAVLHAAGIPWDDRLPAVISAPSPDRGLLARQLDGGFACPPTTSMGRLFDALAALCGGPATISFEAEAALALESWAARHHGGGGDRYGFGFPADRGAVPLVVDWRPVVAGVVRDLLAGEPVPRIAAGFHRAVASLVADLRRLVAPRAAVGLTGGVFQNAVLVELTAAGLRREGVDPLRHRAVPPNDGGLALGQAVLARRRLAAGAVSPS